MDSPLLTLNEAADQLKVSRATLLRWLQSGKLIGAKMGRDWRIDPADLAAFVEASKVRRDRE